MHEHPCTHTWVHAVLHTDGNTHLVHAFTYSAVCCCSCIYAFIQGPIFCWMFCVILCVCVCVLWKMCSWRKSKTFRPHPHHHPTKKKKKSEVEKIDFKMNEVKWYDGIMFNSKWPHLIWFLSGEFGHGSLFLPSPHIPSARSSAALGGQQTPSLLFMPRWVWSNPSSSCCFIWNWSFTDVLVDHCPCAVHLRVKKIQ